MRLRHVIARRHTNTPRIITNRLSLLTPTSMPERVTLEPPRKSRITPRNRKGTGTMTQKTKNPETAKSSRDQEPESTSEAPEPETKGSAVVFLNRRPPALTPASPLGSVVSWSVSMIDECG